MSPKTIFTITVLACIIHFGGTSPQAQESQQGYTQSWDNQDSFLSPYHQNRYGPGIHSDSTGQPFQWETQNGSVPLEPLRVQPNAYGYGIGKDQYSRPVKPKKWP